MTEEQIFKNLFPEYCAGDRCLSPYFDLFQIGFEEGESRLKAIYTKQRNKRIDKLQKQNNLLKKENARLKKESEENQDLATIAYMQGAENQKKKAGKQLLKAREIILKLYNAGRDVLMCRTEEKAYDNLSEAISDRSIEQFLKEV